MKRVRLSDAFFGAAEDMDSEAIAQIKERGYAKPYENSGFDILFIGISYDSKDPSKKHSCLIEEYEGS